MTIVATGMLLALFGLLPYILQARKVLINRSVRGLSFSYCVMLIWSSVIWIIHGVFCRNWVQVCIESSCLAVCVVLLLAFVRFEQPKTRLALAGSLVFCSLIVVAIGLGSEAVSIAALAMPIACRLPQVIRTFATGDPLGVSVPAFAIAIAVELLWMINGALIGDMVTIVAGGICATQALAIAVSCAYRNTRVASHACTDELIAG